MKILKATITNIPELCILLDSLFSQELEFESNRQIQTKALTAVINNKEVGDIFVAIKDEKIVGMINLLYTISTALGGKVALLEDMVISQDNRGLGVGSLLIEHAITYAKQNECQRITLLTDNNNHNAHNFYSKHGFESSSMKTFRKLL